MTPLRYTRQALADALQAWVAMDKSGRWNAFDAEPEVHRTVECWWPHRVPFDHKIVPSLIQITDPPDDWRESLTAPRTEAEPKVCEWMFDGKGNSNSSCGIIAVKRYYPAFDYCPYCSRPIRIVEDDNG